MCVEQSEGYGQFYEIYIDDCNDNMWNIIMEESELNNTIEISNKGYELFDKDVLSSIKEIFIELNNK